MPTRKPYTIWLTAEEQYTLDRLLSEKSSAIDSDTDEYLAEQARMLDRIRGEIEQQS